METKLTIVKVGVKKGYESTKYYSVILPMSNDIIKKYNLDEISVKQIAVARAKDYIKNHLGIYGNKSYDVFKANDPVVEDLDYGVFDSDYNSYRFNEVLGFGHIKEEDYE